MGNSSKWFMMAASLLATLAVGGCAAWIPESTELLPSQVEAGGGFDSYSAVKAAYDQIAPGMSETNLCNLGFDPEKSSNAEMLSYLGVIERFVPRDSIRYDSLPGPVRDCIEAQDHCQAFVFHPSRLSHTRSGDFFMDFFGFNRVTTDIGWSADIVFLVRDHHVVYKIMSGRPYIADVHNVRQPLGPLQDVSNAIAAASMGAKF
ncbi:MAG: hypothetical protein ISS15_20710 [Alphaproteobacteria bacterium]|nr:hypothetical protein [Alphaproteobacteria bacterium]MBL7100086.1 hypothetical protein [Alphaproteobacteria bacterium]